jgi:hypothetical protein
MLQSPEAASSRPGHPVVVVRYRVTKVTTFSNFFSQKPIKSKKKKLIENRVTFVTFLLEFDLVGGGSTLMLAWERASLVIGSPLGPHIRGLVEDDRSE